MLFDKQILITTCNCKRVCETKLILTVHHGNLLFHLPAVEHHVVSLDKGLACLQFPSHIDCVLIVECVEGFVAVLSRDGLGDSDVSLAKMVLEYIQPVIMYN